MKRVALPIVAGLVVFGGAVGIFLMLSGGTRSTSAQTAIKSAAQSPAASRQTVSALGRLVPGRGVVDVAAAPGDRIGELKVSEGQTVKTGDVLFVLESQTIRKLERDLAKTKVDEAKKLLDVETKYGNALVADADLLTQRADKIPALQIQTQDAEINLAELDAQQARLDLDRVRKLVDKNAAEQEDFDRQERLLKQYEAKLRLNRAGLDRLTEEQRLGKLEAQSKKKVAEAGVEKAKQAIGVPALEAALALAESAFERTTVKSPMEGSVLKVLAYPGEATTGRGVVRLADTQNMYAVAEVYETDVRYVRAGQSATVSSPALEKDLTGVVEEIGGAIAKNDVLSIDPTVRSDLRVVEVRIRLNDSSVAGKFVHLQVDIAIKIQP